MMIIFTLYSLSTVKNNKELNSEAPKIIAVGQKFISETEEFKEHNSNSYSSDNENSIESNSKDEDSLLCLEIVYAYKRDINSDSSQLHSKESNPELITDILKEMVECTD